MLDRLFHIIIIMFFIFLIVIGVGVLFSDNEEACPSGITVERIEQNGVTCWVASDGKGHISMDCQ